MKQKIVERLKTIELSGNIKILLAVGISGSIMFDEVVKSRHSRLSGIVVLFNSLK